MPGVSLGESKLTTFFCVMSSTNASRLGCAALSPLLCFCSMLGTAVVEPVLPPPLSVLPAAAAPLKGRGPSCTLHRQ